MIRDVSIPASARWLLLALAVAALAGCTRGTAEVEEFVRREREKPAPPLPPLPVIRQFERFEYAAQSLRDPFSRPIPERNTATGPRPRSGPREELESFPLDGLDMVGTIGVGGSLVGLVMAPDRVVRRVRSGNYLGQNEGRITAVFEDRIEIVELVPDGAGGWMERQAQIALDDN
jgi:type IV pilus assembly protein PilP